MIACYIPTYYKDENSIALLDRAVQSVLNQTSSDYHLLIVGDDYENLSEFKALCSSYPSEKVSYINLPVALERCKYPAGSEELWCAGGVNAGNCAIDYFLEKGYSWVARLDHDDFWDSNHLSTLSELTKLENAVFACTRMRVADGQQSPSLFHFPGEMVYEIIPQRTIIGHSGTCIDFSKIPIRYRDCFAEGFGKTPADADILDRLGGYTQSHNLKGYFSGRVTTTHG
tara:strand:- start:6061 stop:6744 length:684 start_codon:yes stop_codon:yes gene_type:complete